MDLKIDWEEHYFDGSFRSQVDPAWRYLGDEDPSDDETVLPSAEPVVAIDNGDLDAFMDGTAIEAYPDHDDDGIRDEFADEPGETADGGVQYVCEDGADTLADMDPRDPEGGGEGTGLRTDNEDTWDDEDGWKPLVSLDDVKPCDVGGLTLSYHLCDNPGYVWLNGELRENAESGITEPESGVDETEDDGEVDETEDDGELAENLFVRLWYDDGDNVFENDETEIVSGSLDAVMDVLSTGTGIPLSPNGEGTVDPGSDDDGWSTRSIDEEDCEVVEGNPSCGDLGLLRAIKVEADEEPQLPDATVGEEKTYSTVVGDVTITVEEARDGEVDEISFDAEFPVSAVIVKGGPNAHVCQKADGDGGVITVGSGGDREGLGAPFRDGNGRYAISHVSFCYDGEPADEPDDECFEPSTTHYVGLEWWLPCDVGNEVQSDSVSFDLGFYTEQCRHNGDGVTE